MPYMQSACVQFSHEHNIYDSAGALFIDCLSTVVLCDTGDSSVSIVMPNVVIPASPMSRCIGVRRYLPPPPYLRHTAWSGILQRLLCLSFCV